MKILSTFQNLKSSMCCFYICYGLHLAKYLLHLFYIAYGLHIGNSCIFSLVACYLLPLPIIFCGSQNPFYAIFTLQFARNKLIPVFCCFQIALWPPAFDVVTSDVDQEPSIKYLRPKMANFEPPTHACTLKYALALPHPTPVQAHFCNIFSKYIECKKIQEYESK